VAAKQPDEGMIGMMGCAKRTRRIPSPVAFGDTLSLWERVKRAPAPDIECSIF
jgi:hypothetical protein